MLFGFENEVISTEIIKLSIYAKFIILFEIMSIPKSGNFLKSDLGTLHRYLNLILRNVQKVFLKPQYKIVLTKEINI